MVPFGPHDVRPQLLAFATVASSIFAGLGCTDSTGNAPRRATETTSSARTRDGFVINVEPEAAVAADDVGVDLARLTENSLARVADVLPGLKTTVTIEVDPSHVIPEIGIGGYTHSTSGEVFVHLPPEGVNAEALRVWLPEVLAHEAHHSLRIRRGPGTGSTLGGVMVSEGLATVSALEAFPATPLQPWAQALSDQQRRALWVMVQPLLDAPPGPSSLRVYREWFFGTGRIPLWAGYTLGFELVTAYLASHPGATAAALVREPAASIIANSGYDPGPPDPNRPRCFTDAAQAREVLCDQHPAAFAATNAPPEPRRCYVINSAIAAAETTCVAAAADGR